MSGQTSSAKRSRRWRSMLWGLIAIAVLSMALPSLGYFSAGAGTAVAQEGFSEEQATNPRSDVWRAARQGNEGYTAQTGPYVTNTLINNSGQNWRQWRNGPLTTYGGWLLVGVIAALSLIFAVLGQKKIEGGRSGQTIERWNGFERFVHWFVTIGFIALLITGLSLLFGRAVLIPLFGAKGFATYAQFSLYVHNYVGPAFAVGLAVMIVMWLKDNIPTKTDLEWFKQGGGLVGDKHPSAGKLNGGEKAWFWFGVFALGIVVVISGFILDFPNWGFQDRATMGYAHLIHAGGAILWIAMFFGHVYIGTVGTEGALEGMTTGRVDTTWAEQHHDLWYADMIAKGERPTPADSPGSVPPVRPAGGTGPS
jgi:formate dehydrogenase subunit gamma